MVAWEGECKNSRLTVVSSRSGGPSPQSSVVGNRETKDAKHTLSVVLKKLSSKLRAVFFFLDPLTRPHACVGRSSSSRGLRDEEEGGGGRREGRKGRRRRRRRLLFSLSPSSSLISTTLSAAEAERKRERERSRLVPSPSWSMWGKEEKSAQRGKKRVSVPTILRDSTSDRRALRTPFLLLTLTLHKLSPFPPGAAAVCPFSWWRRRRRRWW